MVRFRVADNAVKRRASLDFRDYTHIVSLSVDAFAKPVGEWVSGDKRHFFCFYPKAPIFLIEMMNNRGKAT